MTAVVLSLKKHRTAVVLSLHCNFFTIAEADPGPEKKY